MIVFSGVTKHYGTSAVGVRNISFRIEDGEFVFLVGPSGAGKSTLLRLITRELLPSSGTITVDTWEVHALSDRMLPFLRRKVGVIFQDFKLLADRTVSENVAVSLEILGRKPPDISSRVSDVLRTVGLEGKGAYFPKQLSLGEQQRVAIARAIAGETKILLADEPTGNLDPKTSWEILKILSSIHKTGTTLVVATHNVDIVNSMKKRVIQMKGGEIVRDAKKSTYS